MHPRVRSPGRNVAQMQRDDQQQLGEVVKCLSCNGDLTHHDTGTCKACFEEAKENKEELRRQIDELKALLSFLKIVSPDDPSFPSNSTADYADVILVPADDGSAAPVRAHRAVLMSRSPVFRAMLENDMKENRTGTIRVADVTYDVLHAFVKFLYTGEATLDDQMACDLLGLGEKYEVEHLKDYCEKFLITALNDDNTLASYAFAAKHNANKLLRAALDLITDNMDLLWKHDELYRELAHTEPILIIDIYEKHLNRSSNTAEDVIRLLGG